MSVARDVVDAHHNLRSADVSFSTIEATSHFSHTATARAADDAPSLTTMLIDPETDPFKSPPIQLIAGKGQPGGYPALDADGDVLDAAGNKVRGVTLAADGGLDLAGPIRGQSVRVTGGVYAAFVDTADGAVHVAKHMSPGLLDQVHSYDSNQDPVAVLKALHDAVQEAYDEGKKTILLPKGRLFYEDTFYVDHPTQGVRSLPPGSAGANGHYGFDLVGQGGNLADPFGSQLQRYAVKVTRR